MREIIRGKAREITRALKSAFVEENSAKIEDNLMSYLEGRIDLTSGDTKVFIYCSYGTEVMTHHLIKRLIDMGASVYLPIVRGNIMQAVRVTRDTKFVVGAYGIKEPVGKIYDGEFEFSITPLLAYDKNLNRMGKGKGYYDRFFSGHIVNCKVGLAFKCQEFDSVYPEAHDIKVNAIVNEEEVICE